MNRPTKEQREAVAQDIKAGGLAAVETVLEEQVGGGPILQEAAAERAEGGGPVADAVDNLDKDIRNAESV